MSSMSRLRLSIVPKSEIPTRTIPTRPRASTLEYTLFIGPRVSETLLGPFGRINNAVNTRDKIGKVHKSCQTDLEPTENMAEVPCYVLPLLVLQGIVYSLQQVHGLLKRYSLPMASPSTMT